MNEVLCTGLGTGSPTCGTDAISAFQDEMKANLPRPIKARVARDSQWSARQPPSEIPRCHELRANANQRAAGTLSEGGLSEKGEVLVSSFLWSASQPTEKRQG